MSDSPTQPSDKALDQARSLFENGHYQEARRILESLRASEDPETRAAASALKERLSPAPLTKYLLLLTGLLLLAVTVFAYSQRG